MGRRGHGEGSIFQRPDGRWCSVVDLGFRDGKRARKFYYGASRKEVADKLAVALRDLQKGIPPPDERITVAELVATHLDDLEARNAVKSATINRYRGILRNYLEPMLGRARVARLQPQHVQAYQIDLLRRGMTANTVTLHRALLSGALQEAVAFGLVQRNVVALVKPPKDESEPIGRAMLPEHARALLDLTLDDRLAVFYLVLLTAGLRRGEALGLTWQDIDLHEDGGPTVLHVRRQLQWPGGTPTLVSLKSKRSTRRVPVPLRTTEALQLRRMNQRAEFAAIGKPWRQTELVCTTPAGEPVHRNTITKQFQRYLERAEVPPYRLHDLRHTYGSLLMSQGVPLKTISDLMGHTSIDITADI